ILDVAHLAPNHRATFSGVWTHGRLAVTARENFYSDWIDAVDYPIRDATGNLTGQKFGSKFTSDLDVGYEFTKFFTLSVGGQNLFNTKPDKIAYNPGVNNVYPSTGSLADGQIYPRSGGPFGINGGFWYVRARISL
ncbi:MAG: TonB-dependent receptor, partial [Sphingomonadaceae bacterium]|nr:TonB-dependent receptor [Sphingomonadaceae bacterium]